MEYYKLAPASFAEQIGINRSNLTHLFSGRNQPSLDLAKKILLSYPEIKTEWLIMGVGEMMRSAEEKELNIRIQNENKNYSEPTEPDLFSDSMPEHKVKEVETHVPVTLVESPVAYQDKVSDQIFDSREVEEIEPKIEVKPLEQSALPSSPALSITKIVFFYSDNSFEVYHQK
jgi:transcriptional regulator with XRE-family HTH domain